MIMIILIIMIIIIIIMIIINMYVCMCVYIYIYIYRGGPREAPPPPTSSIRRSLSTARLVVICHVFGQLIVSSKYTLKDNTHNVYIYIYIHI